MNMAKPIFFCSLRERVGKSILSIGIMQKLQNDGKKVAYFKPVGISKSAFTQKADPDVGFILNTVYTTSKPYDIISPVSIPDCYYVDLIDATKRDDNLNKIKSAYEELTREMDYVIIGGYAVSSYGFPRFSVDLDIVISEKEESKYQKLIYDRGFVLSTEKIDLYYFGKFKRYEKGLVSIDLLINAVQSRQTGYSYPFSYIFNNTNIREVSGWDPILKAKIRVPDKEMLIALKIHSMRMADKRDIIMLCFEKPDIDKISSHLKNCPKKKIVANIDGLLSVIKARNMKDSLKGVFSVDDRVFQRSVENCISALEKIKELL